MVYFPVKLWHFSNQWMLRRLFCGTNMIIYDIYPSGENVANPRIMSSVKISSAANLCDCILSQVFLQVNARWQKKHFQKLLGKLCHNIKHYKVLYNLCIIGEIRHNETLSSDDKTDFKKGHV